MNMTDRHVRALSFLSFSFVAFVRATVGAVLQMTVSEAPVLTAATTKATANKWPICRFVDCEHHRIVSCCNRIRIAHLAFQLD